MTATDARDLYNHVMRFGPSSICIKRGKKWEVSFRQFGFPCLFKTKTEAIEKANAWAKIAYETLVRSNGA